MRINVYAEELTTRTEVVTKSPANLPDVTFYGIRFYLVSPDELHNDPDDDDSSAITLWVPWTRSAGHDFNLVEDVLRGLGESLDQARAYDIADEVARMKAEDA